MKSKFKDFLLYSLACIGAVSLSLSVIDKPEENAQPIDRYNIAAAGGAFGNKFIMYNTQTGEYRLLEFDDYNKLSF